jgi:C1A family cysteine protease
MDYIESFGAIPSKTDVRDYKAVCVAATEDFPEEFKLQMPSVKNQQQTGSCVAHAIALVIEYFSRLQGDDNREMSVGYIYGNRSTSTYTGKGMYVRDALEAARKYGDVVQTMFPYNKEVPEIIELFNEQFIKISPDAYANRITYYYRVYNENDIKAALMQHGPVVFSMEWYSDIKIKNGIMNTKQESSPKNGHHCMVIYGWNKDGWLMQNSWGVFFGDNGKAVIPYNVKFNEIWGIIDEHSENLKKEELNNLYVSNAELQEKINQLTNEVQEYLEQITKLHEALSDNEEECRKKLAELSETMLKKSAEIKQAQETINKQNEEIKRLETENLELKKPFSSPIGKIIAKIINFVMNKFKK